ncbi:Ion transport 2 domain protein [Desulfatibacillum aliphaticivorans]|uniref:Ion transport 2 domain protein n=1 Tax=Desulfatibacillum aliphaticivorans TaxID=218208 RepID=B8FF10_DESAL|nr:ion channel [Desulfatibacillum aliphaticivorans]ACL03827.1 Ion transport 2 domain protein [Desulfatibacillum aliphaticivorans]
MAMDTAVDQVATHLDAKIEKWIDRVSLFVLSSCLSELFLQLIESKGKSFSFSKALVGLFALIVLAPAILAVFSSDSRKGSFLSTKSNFWNIMATLTAFLLLSLCGPFILPPSIGCVLFAGAVSLFWLSKYNLKNVYIYGLWAVTFIFTLYTLLVWDMAGAQVAKNWIAAKQFEVLSGFFRLILPFFGGIAFGLVFWGVPKALIFIHDRTMQYCEVLSEIAALSFAFVIMTINFANIHLLVFMWQGYGAYKYDEILTFSDFIYFSTIVGRAVGFGDIVPGTPTAKWLVILNSAVFALIPVSAFLKCMKKKDKK